MRPGLSSFLAKYPLLGQFTTYLRIRINYGHLKSHFHKCDIIYTDTRGVYL